MGWRRGVALLAGLVLMASSALAAEVMVHLGHNKIDPSTLTVKAGTTVVFHNLDAMPGGHSVVADDGSFASPGLDKDGQWSHTFDEPGEYGYSIKEHPAAKGTIIVE